MVTRAAFDIAVEHGDLETIQAFFAQPDVRDLVQATDAYATETAPTDPATFALADGSLPWYRRPKRHSNDATNVSLRTAARRGHVHVVEWFFGQDGISRGMGETLALLLPLVAQIDGRGKFGSRHATVIDVLLMSPVFCELIPDKNKQSILDHIANSSRTPQVVDVAIAHGARLNTAAAVIAHYGIRGLREEYAFLVGADVVAAPSCLWGNAHAADSFLVRGSDWDARLLNTLKTGARSSVERMIFPLLDDGFLDVDIRGEDGITTLMHVASVNPSTDLSIHFYDTTAEIASALLAFCDVNLVDCDGRTALHYAAENNDTIAELLLTRGADPTIRDAIGFAAHDYLDGCDPELMLEFVRAGADPFATPFSDSSDSEDEEDESEEDTPWPRSLYDRLMEWPSGRDVVHKHAHLFEHPSANSST